MRVLVTRPAAQAVRWVSLLNGRGIDAASLPLIDIAPPLDIGPVHAAWQSLAQRRLAVFVSPSAVERFFAERPSRLAWPDGVEAASIGPGTSAVLRDSGVPAASIIEPARDAALFDSESLWLQLQQRSWTDVPVLIVRGDGGRERLAQNLIERGARVEYLQAYRRAAPRFEGECLRLLDAALSLPAEHLWLFSSSEAIGNLVRDRPAANWIQSRALATHPRIVQMALECGFGVVHESRPTLDSVVACIQSIPS